MRLLECYKCPLKCWDVSAKKQRNKGSIYPATQACENSTMRNPKLSIYIYICSNTGDEAIQRRGRDSMSKVGGGMLLLLHALIPCVAADIFSFGLPRVLFLHACVAAYMLPLFLYFLALSSLHPSTFYTLVSLIFHCILTCKYNALCF